MMLVKEELVQYLIKGYIHVSRQDYLFFNNLVKFSNEGTLTTGQDKLLNKLIDKYQKQLRKENFDIEQLKKLPWLHPLVETQDMYRKAYVKVINNEIIIKNPFSKKFMQDLQRLGSISTLEWDKGNKVYRAPFSTFMLKKTVELVSKNFEEVVFCDVIKNILNEVEQYKNCYWNPTLVQVHGQFYIAACNPQIIEQLSNITLDNNPNSFFKLSRLGIDMGKNVNLENELSRFAMSYQYEIDISQVDELIDWLNALQTKNVSVEHHAIYTNSLYKELCNKLEDSGIKITSQNELKYLNSDDYPIIITLRSRVRTLEINKASKIVFIKNSRPIAVK